MTVIGFLLLLLIAGICGAVGQAIVGYSVGGCIVSTVVGIVGALLGYWIANYFNLPLIFTVDIEGQQFPVAWSIIGSTILVATVALLSRPRTARY